MPMRNLVASPSRVIPNEALKHVVPLKQLRSRRTDQILLFVVKVAALEAIRRLSKARCPFVWKFVQALQVLGYAPLKWIHRWGPLQLLVKAVQIFSRPMLFLSMATAFSEHSEVCERTDITVSDPQPGSLSPDALSNSDTREYQESDGTLKDIVSESWLLEVVRDLEKEGIYLPERFTEDELRRFYAAAKGDLSYLKLALKKTIRWRETYYLLSPEELEIWSTVVFWHGFDVMQRPCLVIRLGVACRNLSPHDRPRFAQAIVSQIEHGVLHLVNETDPRIFVLIDCERLSPIRFPMQMMKTCITLVQDNYPNRLAILLIVRLPSVSRVITQAIIKILKPETRQKLRIEGETYRKVLPELLQTVPQFLGGNCNCSKCAISPARKTSNPTIDEINNTEPTDDDSLNHEPSLNDYQATENIFSQNCENILRAALLGILMLWIVIALLAGFHDSEPLISASQ